MLRVVLLLILLLLAGRLSAAEGVASVSGEVAPDIAFIKEVISANDRRYEERFLALQRAMELGLSVQKDAVAVALSVQKEAMALALANADRAVSKAEVSTDERLKLIDVVRSSMLDLQNKLIPRTEVDVKIQAQADKAEALNRVLTDRIEALAKAAEKSQSEQASIRSERSGLKDGWGYAVGVIGFILMLWAAFRVVPKR